MEKYLIDTNIFIESAYRFYAFDICPGFWYFLNKASNSENIKSIIKVYEELQPDKKELENFKEELRNKNFFLQIENIKYESYKKVSIALQKMKYSKEAVNKFSSGADYFLIALAYQESYIIVTHESKSKTILKNQVKIPNLCEQLDIECIDIAEFLRREKVQFILKE